MRGEPGGAERRGGAQIRAETRSRAAAPAAAAAAGTPPLPTPQPHTAWLPGGRLTSSGSGPGSRTRRGAPLRRAETPPRAHPSLLEPQATFPPDRGGRLRVRPRSPTRVNAGSAETRGPPAAAPALRGGLDGGGAPLPSGEGRGGRKQGGGTADGGRARSRSGNRTRRAGRPGQSALRGTKASGERRTD